jgi:anti-sigma factor RsiW
MSEPLREYEHGYTCSQVVELATDYVEGAMPAEHRTHFEMHLNFCDGCFTFIDQIRATAATAGRLSEEQVPEEIKGKLLAAFREWRRE